MEAVVTNGAIRRAKLQSNHHYQQANNIKLFTDPMPFWLPNQQCQSTECIYISLTVNFKCQPLRGTSFNVFENLLIFSLPSIWQHLLSDDCLGYNRGLGLSDVLRGVLYTTVICRSHGQFIETSYGHLCLLLAPNTATTIFICANDVVQRCRSASPEIALSIQFSLIGFTFVFCTTIHSKAKEKLLVKEEKLRSSVPYMISVCLQN